MSELKKPTWILCSALAIAADFSSNKSSNKVTWHEPFHSTCFYTGGGAS